jgi:ABC-type bacteriocin/lantibiotic exporter with double-glycine peptidase domain
LSAAGWPNQIDGTDPRVLEALFRKTGLGVVAGEMTVGMVRHLIGEGWPVVTLVRQGGVGHYVVVCGVNRGRVYLMDPDGGERTETVKEFVDRWRAGDVCRTGFAYFQWGIAAGVE